MSLKPYNELVKVDITPYCDHRKAKDDQGKAKEVPYLNWAKCVELLHEHGAESVYYVPLRNGDGSYLFSSKEVETGKDKRKTGCWFVSVEIHIDELVFLMDMPLLNGNYVVYEDTLNQLRIANCHARAFVKGVAIRTGLGFQLWLGEKDTDSAPDDLSVHNIYAIKQRIEQTITRKLQGGVELRDLLASIGMSEKVFGRTMEAVNNLALLEQKLNGL